MQGSDSQNMRPKLWASASPGSLFEMQILGSHFRPTEPETQGVEPTQRSAFPRPLPDSNARWCWKATDVGFF